MQAQTVTGSLVGVITDSSGAIVLGAEVKASEVRTNFTRSIASDSSGNYIITLLPIGMYCVHVSAKGFKDLIRAGINVNADDRVEADAVLQLGARRARPSRCPRTRPSSARPMRPSARSWTLAASKNCR